MKTIKALSLFLVAALMSVSVIGFSSVAAEEYNEKMYTLKELLEMSKEEYFEEFPEAEAPFNEQKQFYEDEKENTIEKFQAGYDPDLENYEEMLENEISMVYTVEARFGCSVLREDEYRANETEQNLHELLEDSLEYEIISPINVSVTDGAIYYDYLLSITFPEYNNVAVSDENILTFIKIRQCVNQIIPLYNNRLCNPISISTDKKQVLTGDVNLDETVDLYDVIWIGSHLINKFELTEGQQSVGDINSDGVCDLYDAIEISKQLM